jgi:hypothetical protein
MAISVTNKSGDSAVTASSATSGSLNERASYPALRKMITMVRAITASSSTTKTVGSLGCIDKFTPSIATNDVRVLESRTTTNGTLYSIALRNIRRRRYVSSGDCIAKRSEPARIGSIFPSFRPTRSTELTDRATHPSTSSTPLRTTARCTGSLRPDRRRRAHQRLLLGMKGNLRSCLGDFFFTPPLTGEGVPTKAYYRVHEVCYD